MASIKQTENDIKDLNELPDGWFEPMSQHTMNRPEWRCNRLVALGYLEERYKVESGYRFPTLFCRKTSKHKESNDGE